MKLSSVFTGTILPVVGASVLWWPCAPAEAAAQRLEKHFSVKGRPVVVIHNVGNGRIEVKSWKNSEVVVTGTKASDKIAVETEQAGDRIDVTFSVIDFSANPKEMEANFQLTVPEQTELQLKTQTGLIYVEQVNGDMKLESVAGDVHLKEVSGYIIVKTTGGSLNCVLCSGKIEFTSISGNAQILQPSLSNVNLMTMTGNILYEGDFLRTGIYIMGSGKGLVEVRFSDSDSFDLTAETQTGSVDNRAAAFLKPDTHGNRHSGSRFKTSLFGTFGMGLAKV